MRLITCWTDQLACPVLVAAVVKSESPDVRLLEFPRGDVRLVPRVRTWAGLVDVSMAAATMPRGWLADRTSFGWSEPLTARSRPSLGPRRWTAGIALESDTWKTRGFR
ncbi:hypothetical protein ACLOJK_014018 [Asimina triloba]